MNKKDKTDNLQNYISILKEEKRLLFQEKQDVIKVMKQILAMLLVIPNLLIASIYSYNAYEIYMFLPLIIIVLSYYYLSNSNTYIIICNFINQIDVTLQQFNDIEIPTYQTIIGIELRKQKINITKDFKYFTPNFYHYLAFHAILMIAGLYFLSCYEGYKYLKSNFIDYQYLGIIYLSFFVLVFILLIILFLKYNSNKSKMLHDLVDKKFSDFIDKTGISKTSFH